MTTVYVWRLEDNQGNSYTAVHTTERGAWNALGAKAYAWGMHRTESMDNLTPGDIADLLDNSHHAKAFGVSSLEVQTP